MKSQQIEFTVQNQVFYFHLENQSSYFKLDKVEYFTYAYIEKDEYYVQIGFVNSLLEFKCRCAEFSDKDRQETVIEILKELRENLFQGRHLGIGCFGLYVSDLKLS